MELPQCSDIVRACGSGFLRRLELAEPDHTLLREALALHDLVAEQMRAQEKRIALEFKTESNYHHLLSVPGIGPTLAAVSIGLTLSEKSLRLTQRAAADKRLEVPRIVG